jgi:hypothetical protein
MKQIPLAWSGMPVVEGEKAMATQENVQSVENTQSVMKYLDMQAYVGITKHNGGFEATNELLSLCHIEAAQELLDVGCGKRP